MFLCSSGVFLFMSSSEEFQFSSVESSRVEFYEQNEIPFSQNLIASHILTIVKGISSVNLFPKGFWKDITLSVPRMFHFVSQDKKRTRTRIQSKGK